jgi:hypothetical protein
LELCCKEIYGAVLYDFIVNASRDADPLKDGYQVSVVYFVLCLLVPEVMGLVGAVLGFVADRLVRRGNGK